MNNTGGPVDLWAVDGVDEGELVQSSTGYLYLPATIPAERLTLLRADIPEARPGISRRRSEKVVAYIVREGRVLVFFHEDDENPLFESGLQVPAGTLEPGESPEEGVLREAREETGLPSLSVVRYLGHADYDMRPYADAIHHRHFFHLATGDPVAEDWGHVERGSGHDIPRRFRFSWLPISRGHVLAAGLGAMLGRLENPGP
ncbi:MAG TPA: NUDIX domain-containing protein [Acidimicrobiia bacterium]|nr:NUDIX domain-containing protein [Acidimicrobiia bacterium]